jgi:hypothetical protein
VFFFFNYFILDIRIGAVSIRGKLVEFDKARQVVESLFEKNDIVAND